MQCFVPGLFEAGGRYTEAALLEGIAPKEIAFALDSAERGIVAMSASALLTRAREASAEAVRAGDDAHALVRLLDLLASSENPAHDHVFERWFALRSRLIGDSLIRIANAGGQRDFGSNAYGPTHAMLTGVRYPAFAQVADFVQPLLGYMNWHELQPMGSWASYISSLNPRTTFSDAVEIPSVIFGAPGGLC